MKDTIFHSTTFQSASNFLEYNGIKTSDLLLNKQELEATKPLNKKQYLYYLSLTRSLTSSFIQHIVPHTIIHIKKQYIKNLGTITPFNFHHNSNTFHKQNYHEMEDRLLTNLPIIPLDAIQQISIIIPHYQSVHQTFHIANLLNNNKVKIQSYKSLQHLTKNQPQNYYLPPQPIPPQQLDGTEYFIHFLLTNKIPPSTPHIQYSTIPGITPTLSKTENFSHPNNIKNWHNIRLFAKHHNLNEGDIINKLYEYKSLVQDQYNPG
jgi:hypothetical protein